jgi:hypothetical protein
MFRVERIFRLVLQDVKLIASGRIFTYLGWLLPSPLTSFPRWLHEAVLVLAALWIPFLRRSVEWAVSKEVAMLMAFPAAEGNMLIVDGLRPVFVVIFQRDGAGKRLGYVQIHAYSGIRGVASLLSGFG